MSPVKLPSTPPKGDSPRPSTDNTSHTPTSPFLHNLTSRLRKGSTSSSHHASVDHSPPPQDPVTKTESTRAARKTLQSLVRNDWQFPPTTDKNATYTSREPVGYRLREESLSDLEMEELFARRRTKHDPYKFDNPDSIGNHLAERKLKRKRALEEELEWNNGLRIWSQQRDAWTGAVKHKPQDNQSRRHSQLQSPRLKSSHYRSRLSHSTSHERNGSASTNGSNSHSHSHSHSHSGSISATSTTNPPLSTSPQHNEEESSSVDTSLSSGSTTTHDADGPYLPLFSPLLADTDNDTLALRSRIKPSAYPTIYSKIVVQSLAPNVPIPLNHMIAALVEGWKSEGNWPPQPSAMAANVDGIKKKGKKSAAFLRWRKENSTTSAASGLGLSHLDGSHAGLTNGHAHMNPDVDESGKSRVRRSIGMVKKVLGGGSGDGLHELGIEFREQDTEEMDKVVTLNKGLL